MRLTQLRELCLARARSDGLNPGIFSRRAYLITPTSLLLATGVEFGRYSFLVLTGRPSMRTM